MRRAAPAERVAGLRSKDEDGRASRPVPQILRSPYNAVVEEWRGGAWV